MQVSKDFDFIFGEWNVHHRRLKERLAGCTEWETFAGTSQTRPVLGGNGNIEDNLLHFPAGAYRAIAVRSYDPATQAWAIWWLSENDPHHLDVPVIGRFEGDTGVFLAQEMFDGVPVKVRFLWVKSNPDAPRWEQAMSRDDGASWETNWTMEFVRA